MHQVVHYIPLCCSSDKDALVYICFISSTAYFNDQGRGSTAYFYTSNDGGKGSTTYFHIVMMEEEVQLTSLLVTNAGQRSTVCFHASNNGGRGSTAYFCTSND